MTGNKMIRRGFTLLELLIVAAVFTTITLVATTVYINIQSYQNGILTRQRIVADGRYVLESMARTIRVSSIDYGYYLNINSGDDACTVANGGAICRQNNGVAGPLGIIATRDENNWATCFRLHDSAIENLSLTNPDNECSDTDPNWVPITPSDLIVEGFSVYINPKSDPFMSVPTSTSNHCLRLLSFDLTRGVCDCNTVANCYSGQTCASTNPTKLGQICGGGESDCICQNVNDQPTMTIVLKTKSVRTRPGEQAKLQLQTTVVSRVYRR